MTGLIITTTALLFQGVKITPEKGVSKKGSK
jgi:hypothetical protein